MTESETTEEIERKPLVLEIWTWTGNLTKAAEADDQWDALPSVLIESGDDLRTEEARARVRSTIEIHKPGLVLMAFPCAPWSQLQRMQKPKVKERVPEKRERDMVFLRFAAEIAKAQLRQGVSSS